MADKLASRDDEELLSLWRAGDPMAGDMLFRRYTEALYRFFVHKVEHGVEDLAQETFMALLRGVGGFRGDSTFKTYLFRIARNTLYAYLRRYRKTRERLDFSVSSLKDLGITPRTRLARGQRNRMLLNALRSLPLELQIMLEHRYWQDMDISELADLFEVSEAAMYQRLSRARKLLRQRIQDITRELPNSPEELNDLDSWARSVREELFPANPDQNE